jgi:hypothetical protein
VAPVLLDRHDLYGETDALRIRELHELPALLGISGETVVL